MRLSGPLHTYVIAKQLGETYAAETGFLVARNPDTVRTPDFAFVQRDHVPSRDVDALWAPVIPDLVIEVASSGDRPAELRRKAEMWVEAGVRMVWVALPSPRVIEVYRPGQPVVTLGEADTLDGADVVPGFSAPVAPVFE